MNKRDKLGLIILGCSVWLWAGCGKEHGRGSLDLMEPVGLDKNLVFVDKTSDDAYLLDVVSDKLAARVRTVRLPRAPWLVDKRKGSEGKELLVLCRGQEEQIDQPSEPANLAVLNSKGVVARKYELKYRFNALVQSDDGSLAIVYFDQSQKDDSSSDLSRRNEVAIVDLSKPAASANPVFRQLDSEDGSAPRALVISPTISVVGISRRLAVALFSGQVSLIDLSELDGEHKDIKIPFENPIATSPVIFSGGEPAAQAGGAERPATIYLRSEKSDDIYIIDLLQSSGKSNDFWPTIKMRKSGGTSSDIALYQEVEGEGASETRAARLLVVSEQAQRVSIIDPSTGNVSYVSLGFAANRALIFNATAPFDAETAPRALLYNDAARSSLVGFLDLVRVRERGAQNLEIKDLAAPFGTLLSLNAQQPQVALVQPGSGIKILDLADRTVDPIATGPLAGVLLDPQGKTLWLPSAPDSTERVQLGFIDVDTRDTGYVLLDASIEKVVPIASGDKRRVVVTHPSEVGYVTVLDGKAPKRDTAVTLQGFLVAGALD
jgi:hypothetical protein